MMARITALSTQALASPVNISLASFPGRRFEDALAAVLAGLDVPVLGPVRSRVIQLCPQNRGQLTPDLIAFLRQEAGPGVELRLHANVRVLPQHMILDVSCFDHEAPKHPYWLALREAHRAAGSSVYTAHAGRRTHCTMDQMIDRVRALSDFMGCQVAVEGLYPSRQDPFLMSSWDEWAQVLRSGVPFVVDVSHAAIIAHMGGGQNPGLLGEMLASENCLEIHLSGNDGRSDQHRAMTGQEWWWPLMSGANPKATIFYEGIVRKMHEPAAGRNIKTGWALRPAEQTK